MEQNDKLKKAIGIAAAFFGWLVITTLIMIGFYQLMAAALQWNPYASGTFAFVVWLVMLIAPPAMIASYLDDSSDDDD